MSKHIFPEISPKKDFGKIIGKPLTRYESAAFSEIGGRGDRTRTCDSLVPNQERYQLRYTSLP